VLTSAVGVPAPMVTSWPTEKPAALSIGSTFSPAGTAAVVPGAGAAVVAASVVAAVVSAAVVAASVVAAGATVVAAAVVAAAVVAAAVVAAGATVVAAAVVAAAVVAAGAAGAALHHLPWHLADNTGQVVPVGAQYLHGLPFAMTSRTY